MKSKLLFLIVTLCIPLVATFDATAGEWFLFRSRRVVVREYRVIEAPVVVVPAPVVVPVRVVKLGPLVVVVEDDDDDD